MKSRKSGKSQWYATRPDIYTSITDYGQFFNKLHAANTGAASERTKKVYSWVLKFFLRQHVY
jgi:hypothetical protein